MNYSNFSFSVSLKYQQITNWVNKFSIFTDLELSLQRLYVHRSVSIITACAMSHDPQLQYHACITNSMAGAIRT